MLKHVGIRPSGQLRQVEDGRVRKTYVETLDDETYKIWNNKLLRSGCGRTFLQLQENDSLLYCPYCEEWCNKNQFIEES